MKHTLATTLFLLIMAGCGEIAQPTDTAPPAPSVTDWVLEYKVGGGIAAVTFTDVVVFSDGRYLIDGREQSDRIKAGELEMLLTALESTGVTDASDKPEAARIVGAFASSLHVESS